MIRFSLVVATCGRTTEVTTLLTSILCQRRNDIEVILVDQNADDRLLPVIEAVEGRLTIRHLRTEKRNVSDARNLGLDAAQGEIVAFPDDDCWYPDNLLDGVDQWFKTSRQHSVLAVGAIDDEGIPSGNRWIQDSCEITRWNSLRTTFCSSLFISAVEESRKVRFDPMIVRGEETDFILRLLETGLRGRFDRSLHVCHPRRDMMSGTVSRQRAISYGAGMGRLVRRHSLTALWTALVAYDLVRAGLVVLRGRPSDAAFCFAHATGLFKGFVLREVRMTNLDQKYRGHTMNRRAFLQSLSATVAGITATAAAQPALLKPSSAVASLRLAAQQSGKILGTYTVKYQLLFDPQATAMIAEGFSLIADGNDLKFSDRLRPSPDAFDFSSGDTVVSWAQQHHMLFRGHCLIWWNGLPKWFNSYVNQKNAEQVMVKHISTVVKHYAGRVYSWDVVNEPLHNDGRPDGLRRKPWVDLLGPQYIDIAFHTAADADPKARRVLNECYIEHNTPGEIGRRATLLALATRLKKAGVPITTIGMQSHLRGATPLDGPGLTTFMKQIQDLGLDIMVTELDVDDVDVPEPKVAQAVGDKYSQFLDIVNPYVRVITFEGLQDDPAAPHTHNLFLRNKDASGSAYMTARAFGPALTALQRPGGASDGRRPSHQLCLRQPQVLHIDREPSR